MGDSIEKQNRMKGPHILAEEKDAFAVRELFDKKYGEGSFYDFYDQMKDKITLIDKLKYAMKKSLRLGESSIWAIYTPYDSARLNAISVLNILYPVSFSGIYCFLLVELIIIIARYVRKRQIDLLLLSSFVLIFGNLFVAIYGAPYETARLCLIILPTLIISLAYMISLIKIRKTNRFAITIRVGKTR